MLPVEARTALKAIRQVAGARPFTVERLQLDNAFEEYAIGKSLGRKAKVVGSDAERGASRRERVFYMVIGKLFHAGHTKFRRVSQLRTRPS